MTYHEPFEREPGSGRWFYRCSGGIFVGQEDTAFGPFRSEEATRWVIEVHMEMHEDEEQSA